MNLNPTQSAALVAAVNADPTLLAMWTAGQTGNLRERVNAPSVAGDIPTTRDNVVAAATANAMMGKISARIDTVRAKAAGVAAKAVDPVAADLSVLEAQLASLHHATSVIAQVSSIDMTKASGRTLVRDALDALRALTPPVITAGDKQAIMDTGRGLISIVENIAGYGSRISESELVDAMKGV